MSQGVYVLEGKCPEGKCQRGKGPEDKCPGGIFPWGKVQGSTFPGRLCPRTVYEGTGLNGQLAPDHHNREMFEMNSELQTV